MPAIGNRAPRFVKAYSSSVRVKTVSENALSVMDCSLFTAVAASWRIGTLFENAKLIFPLWAVETASAAIFITSGTTGLIAVKSRLLLHEQFKRPLLALCEIHSGCASFPAGIKKRHNFFEAAA